MAHDSTWPHLKRDLRFYPSTCDQPRRLSQEQIEAYNQNGYLKGFRIFNDEETTANRHYLDKLLANLESDKNSYSINGYHRHCQGLYDLVVNPTILEYVQDLLGPNFVCWGTHYFCKMPGDGKNGLMASRCALLAPNPLKDCHCMACHRRCGYRKRLYAIYPRIPSPWRVKTPRQRSRRRQRAISNRRSHRNSRRTRSY